MGLFGASGLDSLGEAIRRPPVGDEPGVIPVVGGQADGPDQAALVKRVWRKARRRSALSRT